MCPEEQTVFTSGPDPSGTKEISLSPGPWVSVRVENQAVESVRENVRIFVGHGFSHASEKLKPLSFRGAFFAEESLIFSCL